MPWPIVTHSNRFTAIPRVVMKNSEGLLASSLMCNATASQITGEALAETMCPCRAWCPLGRCAVCSVQCAVKRWWIPTGKHGIEGLEKRVWRMRRKRGKVRHFKSTKDSGTKTTALGKYLGLPPHHPKIHRRFAQETLAKPSNETALNAKHTLYEAGPPRS